MDSSASIKMDGEDEQDVSEESRTTRGGEGNKKLEELEREKRVTEAVFDSDSFRPVNNLENLLNAKQTNSDLIATEITAVGGDGRII